jgi:diguanylate cyclase (GGDEF)-like protein
MNRRAVFSSARIEVAQARRSSLPVSIGVLDIDYFKRINDTYGHPTGDAVIRKVSSVLRDSLREADIVGRIGGEEFMVILANTLPDDAMTVMERIRRAVEAEVVVHGGATVNCTVSCGLATLGAADDLDSLVARADECLYLAKNGGRNRVVA